MVLVGIQPNRNVRRLIINHNRVGVVTSSARTGAAP